MIHWNSSTFRMYQTDLWGVLITSGKVTRVSRYLTEYYRRFKKRSRPNIRRRRSFFRKFEWRSPLVLRFDPPRRKLKTYRRRLFYQQHLLELRKFRKFYCNVTRSQFRYLIKKSTSPIQLISLLERRLDLLFFRAGLIPSLQWGRYLISYGNIFEKRTSKKVDKPGYYGNLGQLFFFNFLTKKNTFLFIQKITLLFMRRFLFTKGNFVSFFPPPYLEVDRRSFSFALIADIKAQHIFYPFKISHLSHYFLKRYR